MSQIYNTDLFKELKEGGKLQQTRDTIPSQLADKVVPVMEVNPKLMRRSKSLGSAVRTTSGNFTVLTTSTSSDTYITHIDFGFSKDAACDVASGRLQITGVIDGANINLTSLPLLTLTAENLNTSIDFTSPIKLDRGSNITMTGTFTVGSLIRNSSIIGYTVDNTNA